MASPVQDLALTARTHAARGAWEDVRQLLASNDELTGTDPELVTIRAESELRTGHPREARSWLSRRLPTLERSGDRAAVRKALNYLGVADVELGALDEAHATFARAVELARAEGDDLLLARATNNLGAIANMRGRRAEALALYELAIPAYQRLGHAAGLAESFHNIAITCRQIGQFDRASDYELRAMIYAREAGNPSLLAFATLGRAELALACGDAQFAKAGAERAAERFVELGDGIREGDALRLLGAAALAAGELETARTALDRALTLAREHGHVLNEAEALEASARLRARSGDLASAHAEAQQAIGNFERLGATAERDGLIAWLARLGG